MTSSPLKQDRRRKTGGRSGEEENWRKRREGEKRRTGDEKMERKSNMREDVERKEEKRMEE